MDMLQDVMRPDFLEAVILERPARFDVMANVGVR